MKLWSITKAIPSNSNMKKRAMNLLGVVAVFFLILRNSFGEPILPESLSSLPVLIQIPSADGKSNWWGTGMYLTWSNKSFLVTAAHCIFDTTITTTSVLKGSNATFTSFALNRTDPESRSIYHLNLDSMNRLGDIKRHSQHDVAVILMCTLNETNSSISYMVDGVTLETPMTHTTLSSAVCDQTVKTFGNLEDGKDIYILGFPIELLNDQFPMEVAFDHPLIRRGIISQRNQRTQKLIIDSGVYGGNSGGPVLVVDHTDPFITSFKITGIITEFVPVSTRMFPEVGVTNSVLVNSGYGVAEPIDFALELMRQF